MNVVMRLRNLPPNGSSTDEPLSGDGPGSSKFLFSLIERMEFVTI